MTAVAACLLSVLLADAAVETFLSGSAARWWVVATVALYGVASVVLWRRATWPTRAAAALTLLLAIVAGTAWLPDGQTAGVHLAGLSTPTIHLLLIAAGIACGVGVIWRTRALPRPLRVVTVFAGAVGLAALAQSVLLGAFLILPLALLLAVVQEGVPRLRAGRAPTRFFQTVTIATSLALVLSTIPHTASATRAAAPSAASRSQVGFDAAGRASAPLALPARTQIVPSRALSTSLEHSLRAIEDGERESPRDRWDPAYVAAQVGPDPGRLYAWVRDNTAWVPYRGELRGPVGVLMDRVGNSVDLSLLLATLLERAGHTVRLAHATLAPSLAADPLARLLTSRQPVTVDATVAAADAAPPTPPASPRQAAADYHLDPAAVTRLVAAGEAGRASVKAALAERVADQSARLMAAIRPIGRPDPNPLAAAIEALRDHWWVQVRQGDAWTDMDLLQAAGAAGPLARADTYADLDTLRGVPQNDVTMRVVTERWANGALRERTALTHTLRPADVIGTPINLQFWPLHWPSGFPPAASAARTAFLRAVVDEHAWLATLVVGTHIAAQVSIDDTGAVNEHPATSVVAKIGGSLGSAFSGLGGELAPAPDPAKAASADVLTAVWIEFDTQAPGDARRTVRRQVFDLVGAAARAAGVGSPPRVADAARRARSLSLMMSTEVLPVACGLAQEFVAHLRAQGLLANREILQALVRGDLAAPTTRAEDLAQKIAPLPGPLHALARARLAWSRHADKEYVDRPDIFTRHVLFAPRGATVVLRSAIDIVANDIGVDPLASDPMAIRVEQGVLDTNLEALIQAGDVVDSTAEAYRTSTGWVTLARAPGERSDVDGTPGDVRAMRAADIAAGYTVIAPRAPVRLGSQAFHGWWRVDPASGLTLGVGSNGWGDAMVEYAFLLSVGEAFAVGFLMTYFWCRIFNNGNAQADIADACVPRVPGLGLFDVPVHAQGLSSCLTDALISGVLAGGLQGFLGRPMTGRNRPTQPLDAPPGEPRTDPGEAQPDLAKTQPDLGETLPDLGETQPDLGRTQPDLGKTQPRTPRTERDPDLPFELGKTQRAPEQRPATREDLQRELAEAATDMVRAQHEHMEATQKALRYSVNDPARGWYDADPSQYNADEFHALMDEARQAGLASQEAGARYTELKQMARQMPVNKGGGFPPAKPAPSPAPEPPQAPAPCPPSCGASQAKTVAGSAGVETILRGGGK